MIFMGIDPGYTKGSIGSIAVITPEKIELFDLPPLNGELSLSAIVAPYLQRNLPILARIEEQGIRHGDIDVGAVWNVVKLIRHEQMCVSVLQTLGIPVNRVQSARWKSVAGLRGEAKTASIGRLIELYPDCRHSLVYTAKNGHTKRNHNRADAGLIAHSLKVDLEKEQVA